MTGNAQRLLIPPVLHVFRSGEAELALLHTRYKCVTRNKSSHSRVFAHPEALPRLLQPNPHCPQRAVLEVLVRLLEQRVDLLHVRC